MYYIQLEYHHAGRSNLMLQPLHLKAIAFEYHFRIGCMGYSFEYRLHLSWVETCLRHKHVEGDGKKPEGGNVELAGLQMLISHARNIQARLTRVIMLRIVLSMLTR